MTVPRRPAYTKQITFLIFSYSFLYNHIQPKAGCPINTFIGDPKCVTIDHASIIHTTLTYLNNLTILKNPKVN